MEFTCHEDRLLPHRTVHASYRTALKLRGCFAFTSFEIGFDESLPNDLLLISSDLHSELEQFLVRERHPRPQPAE